MWNTYLIRFISNSEGEQGVELRSFFLELIGRSVSVSPEKSLVVLQEKCYEDFIMNTLAGRRNMRVWTLGSVLSLPLHCPFFLAWLQEVLTTQTEWPGSKTFIGCICLHPCSLGQFKGFWKTTQAVAINAVAAHAFSFQGLQLGLKVLILLQMVFSSCQALRIWLDLFCTEVNIGSFAFHFSGSRIAP